MIQLDKSPEILEKGIPYGFGENKRKNMSITRYIVWVQNPKTKKIGWCATIRNGTEFEVAIPKGEYMGGGEDDTKYTLTTFKKFRTAKRYLLKRGFTAADEDTLANPLESKGGTNAK